MKFFRTVFWLGVVIYNLSNTSASNPAQPQSQGNQSLAAKATGKFCPQPPNFCAKTVDALPKHGDLGGHDYWRDALKPSQDTLVPGDRVVPWRGTGVPKGPM